MAMLADPTDWGSRPGDGPLRPGGQASASLLPESEDDLPSKPSKAVEAQAESLALVRDLWGGTGSIRAKTTDYLPKAFGEDGQDYAARLKRSAFFNAFRRTVEGLAGLAFRKDPVLNDDVPPQIAQHWENIDNAGTHGDVFLHAQFVDAEAAGHNAILVEFPRTDGVQNAAQEITGEVRPYWVPVLKDNIVSWRTTMENGRLVLTQLVLKECDTVAAGRFAEAKRERYRVFIRDELGVRFELLSVSSDRKVILEDEGSYPTQDEIPVAEIVTSGHRSMFESEPPLLDLAWLNVAHYQMWSDYNWSIHKTCVPFIFGAGIEEAYDQNGQPVELALGANTAAITKNPGATMRYVSHDGSSLGSVKSALDDLKSDMGTLGLAMLAPQKRAAETVEAKRMDKATSDSALSVSVRGLQDGVERAMYFHARYLGLESGGSVTLNRDFEGLLMDAPVMTAFATLVNAGFPARPVLEALQQGGRIGEDADLDLLEMEWTMGKATLQALPGDEPPPDGEGDGAPREDPLDEAA